jgi:hypothetical protein
MPFYYCCEKVGSASIRNVRVGSEADVKPISREATSGAISGTRLGRDAGRCVEKDAGDKRAAKVGLWLAKAEDEEADGVGDGSNGEHAGEP